MIDLHTHILPDWDDGAVDWETAERMLALAREDGIGRICLTPHIYRQTKHGDDPGALRDRMNEFIAKTKGSLVELYAGAEVYIHPDMAQNIKEHGLTVNGSRYVFIEFPAEHVPNGTPELIFQITIGGFVPIISHPERNAVFANRPGVLFELVGMGALGQVTAQSLTGGFGRKTRDAAECLMKLRLIHLIASDAHNDGGRAPQLSEAVERAAKVVGEKIAKAMVTDVPAAILEDREIPDLGDPIAPSRKKWLDFFNQ
jgi:protein-tyrosine phosphatase